MDDRYAQFLLAVGELCMTAELARLDIEVLTAGGLRATGVPNAMDHRYGYGDEDPRAFQIDDHAINLDEIRECALRAPSELPPGAGI